MLRKKIIELKKSKDKALLLVLDADPLYYIRAGSIFLFLIKCNNVTGVNNYFFRMIQ